MNLSFRNRIAFNYMLATAIIMAVVFVSIYFIVQGTVMSNLDNDLSYEAEKHTKEILIIGDSIKFINKAEWEEKEHREIQVNPVFIQIIAKGGILMDKSPNLKEDFLPFEESENGGHFNTKLNNRSIRQVQLPILENKRIKGYILAAMSLESAQSVILKLRNVLGFSYITVLIGLYFISRFLAGRSIKPVKEVTNTITRITKNNLKERVVLPPHKDEIYELSSNFNSLVERIENAIERERQFTSDASHELRTPLSTLRGTLEVLIRKPRNQVDYEEKIKYSLTEIDKMTSTLEQLLLLARLDTKTTAQKNNYISLPSIINDSLISLNSKIIDKELKVELLFDTKKDFLVPDYYTSLIINNLLSNAVKYSKNKTALKIHVIEFENQIKCAIEDEGIGIDQEDLTNIFDNFFRSDSLNHKQITGNGLGLSIVKKCSDAIGAKIDISSKVDEGTVVTVIF